MFSNLSTQKEVKVTSSELNELPLEENQRICNCSSQLSVVGWLCSSCR